ncbi:hypothetical protein Bpla01_50170 [Burkholderia plantarii]|uniref:Ethyl tert-butyl ether degradation EthD n=2 Tax=Burkholderia plantarii TaxID=41899 RepID=A0A0B6SC49_BURPL|nr:hypothetical protein BGL_2c17540 [Burkholderia plantarii]GLZ21488.1 hypothetical protein Bpla01_50170 [Burkholderia plantarii]
MLYRADEAIRFDGSYYRDHHVPLVAERIGDLCESWEVDFGVATGEVSPPFLAVGHFHTRDLDGFLAALQRNRAELEADLDNCSSHAPQMQISKVAASSSRRAPE